jgi:hypothetical protein
LIPWSLNFSFSISRWILSNPATILSSNRAVWSSVGSFLPIQKANLRKIFWKCYLKISYQSFEISPLKCCNYLEAPMFVELHFPLRT